MLSASNLDFDKDCAILEMYILLALDINDFNKADEFYQKLKELDKDHETVRDYKILRKIAQDKTGDVFKVNTGDG